jgi:enoyl-CoA hydratase
VIDAPCDELNVELVERDLIVTLNRPASRNALNTALLQGLEKLVAAAARDDDVATIVLTGSGDRAFSAGADIKEWMANKSFADIEGFLVLGHRVFNALEECAKPVICAVNGVTLGGGLELALACDVRVAADAARFAFPEPTLGAFPGWGGLRRLSAVVGLGRAKEIAMTTRQVEAQEAMAIGLVSRVTALDGLLDAARDISAQMQRVGPLALAQVKRLTALYAGASNALLSQYLEVLGNAMLANTLDFGEGERAFLEKRSPRFTGR